MGIFGSDKRVSERKLDKVLQGLKRGGISEDRTSNLRKSILGDGTKPVTQRDLRLRLKDAEEHYVTKGFKKEHLARFKEAAELVKKQEPLEEEK